MRKDESHYAQAFNALGGSLRWSDLTDDQKARFVAVTDEGEAAIEEQQAQIKAKREANRKLEVELAVAQERLRMGQEHGLFGKRGASTGPKLF